MVKLNLWGDNDIGITMGSSNAENINCYTMPSTSGRNPVYLTGVMGTKLHATLNNVFVAARGCIAVRDVGYVVAFNTLYSVTVNATVTALGSVPGTSQVSIATDGINIMVVNGTGTAYYYNRVADNFFTVTLPFIANTIAFTAGYVICSSNNQRFFISVINDSVTFNALDFATAESFPDDLLSAWIDHGEIMLFGEKSIEVWFNSAAVEFAFSRNPSGVIERGLYARFAVTQNDNATFILGDDLIMYRIQGYQLTRISDESIEIRLAKLRDDGFQSDLANANMYSYTEHGHKFIQLNIPNQVSLTYNITTSEWFTSKHFDYETSIGTCYFNLNDRHFIGGLDGKIYEMTRNAYDDAGRPLKRGRITQFFSAEDKITHWKSIKFIMDFGTTEVIVGQGSDPKMVLRWSYDSGRTWRNEKFLSLSQNGKYLGHAIKRNCGASRNRQLEFYVTDPVPFNVLDAFAEIN